MLFVLLHQSKDEGRVVLVVFGLAFEDIRGGGRNLRVEEEIVSMEECHFPVVLLLSS